MYLTRRTPFYFFFFVILLVITNVNTSSALQSPDVTFFGIREGLPHLTVYSIKQSPDGFMWFGTENGLVRFDGNEMVYYDPSTSPALSGSNISTLLVDSEEKVWAGLWGEGINLIDPVTGTIRIFRNQEESDGSLSDNRAQTLYQTADGTIWAGTFKGGLNQFIPADSSWKQYHQSGLISANSGADRIWSILETSRKELFIGTESGLFVLNRSQGYYEQVFGPSNRPAKLKSLQIRCLSSGPDGWIWMGTDFGLYRYHPERKILQDGTEFLPIPIPDNIINQIVFTTGGNVWIGTYKKGLFVLDPVHKTLVPATIPDSHTGSKDIRAIFEDNSGNIWAGGRGSGLLKFNGRYQKFFRLPAHTENNAASASLDVLSLTGKSDGTVFLGTNGQGIYRFIPGNPTLGYLEPPHSEQTGPDATTHLYYDEPADILWAGTRNFGLFGYNRNHQPVYHYKSPTGPSGSLSNNSIRFILKTKAGIFWVGTKGGGLNRIDIKLKSTRVYLHDPGNPESIGSNDIRFVSETSDGSVWVGTDGGGISRMTGDGNRFESWTTNSPASRSVSNNDVTCFFEAPDGKLWIGTDGGGVNIIDPITGNVRLVPVETTGHPVITGIKGDGSGSIWIQTLTGITRYNPISMSGRLFRPGDGIPSSIFNFNSLHTDPAGTFYFGGVHGVTTFVPDNMNDNMVPPKTVITGFKIYNTEWIGDSSITHKRLVELNPSDNFLTFSFSVLDFVNPANNRYKYKLSGFDENWIEAGSRRFASYTNLSAGTYHFRVIGSNSDGTWSEPGDGLILIVHPVFWKTWWFQGILILLLGIGIWLYVSTRTTLIRNQNIKLEEQIRERTSELILKNEELEKTLSHLHNTQAQLFQQEKMASLGTLVAGVAHEINNPVNFIHSSIPPLIHDIRELIREMEELEGTHEQILKDLEKGDQAAIVSRLQSLTGTDREEYLQELKAEIELLLKGVESGSVRTAEIVKSLRMFTRVDEDTWKPFSIHEGLDSTIQILMPKWKNRVEIVRNYGNVPEIECFPGQINQVFMNILVNALDAIGDKGTVTIRTVQNRSMASITISDTGTGIPPELVDRIFEPFYTTKPVGKGTGLGLAISYEIIQKHQGTITVSSKPTEGTSFIINLPIRQTGN